MRWNTFQLASRFFVYGDERRETWMVHICGLMLLAGRLMHYYGFHHRLFRWRRSGMIATYLSLLLMVLMNLWYMPWELVFSLR